MVRRKQCETRAVVICWSAGGPVADKPVPAHTESTVVDEDANGRLAGA